MPVTRRMFVVLSMALAMPSFSQGADDPAARAIVDRAIEKLGGEKLLSKFPAMTSKIKGSIYIAGNPVPFTGEISGQKSDQQKALISFSIDGQAITLISVVDRDKGWIKINENTMDMPAEQLAETKEAAYAGWAATLVPLKDKAFSLSQFGETEIAGRKAVGVNVTREGHRPINVFFDKETLRMVRSETRVKDEATGQEVTEESTFSDFKIIEGIQQPSKVTVKRDGKPHADVEVEEFKPSEKLDDSVFAKP